MCCGVPQGSILGPKTLPNNMHKLFVLYDPMYMTRQKCVFKQKYARTNLKTMCISINGVKLWNSLTAH